MRAKRRVRAILISVLALIMVGLVLALRFVPLSSNNLTLEQSWKQVPWVEGELEKLLHQVQAVPNSIYDWYEEISTDGLSPWLFDFYPHEEIPAEWGEEEFEYLAKTSAQIAIAWDWARSSPQPGVLYEPLWDRFLHTEVLSVASVLESREAHRGNGWRLLALLSGLIVADADDEDPRGAARGYGEEYASLVLSGVPVEGFDKPLARPALRSPEEVREVAREFSKNRIRASWISYLGKAGLILSLEPNEWATVWWVVERVHSQGLETGEAKLGWEKHFLRFRGEGAEFGCVELATRAQAIQFRILHSRWYFSD